MSSSPSSSISSSPPPPGNRNLALALFACLQNALVGGIIYGWASIDRTLLQAPLPQGGANLTPSQTTQLFTFGSSTAMLASLVLGPLLDAKGPRTCLATSHLLVLLGCTGLALATEFWHFSLAVISIAFGGPGIGLAIIHIANLFPSNRFLAVSCLAGSITLSFSMLAILETIWETYGVGFRTLFGGYSLVVALSLTGTLLVSPDEPYEMEEDDEEEEDTEQEFHPSLEQEYVEATLHTYAHHHQHPLLLTDQSLNSTLRREGGDEQEAEGHPSQQSERSTASHMHLDKRHSFYQSQEALQSGNETAVKLMSLKDQPFAIQLQSPTFARVVLIFVTISFLANFTIASLTTELEDVNRFSSQQQHDLSQQFTWLLSLGLLYSVLVGWLMDRLGLEVCTLLTLILGQLSSLLILVASLPAYWPNLAYLTMMVGFGLYSLFRQFLFPVFLAYITARFGFKYFGMLTSIGFALSGLAQCFMAHLVAWVHYNSNATDNSVGGWKDFHLLQILVMACLMVIPIADHRDIQRREAQMERALHPKTASPASTATTMTPLRQERTKDHKDVEYGSLLSG